MENEPKRKSNFNTIPEFTEDERKIILDAINRAPKTNPPSLKEMIQLIAKPGEEIDGRSVAGRKVMAICASFNFRPKTTKHDKKMPIILTDDQKLYIQNNLATLRIIEIARAIFPEIEKIQPLGLEVKAINDYVRTLGDKVVKSFNGGDQEEVSEGDYIPPRTFHEMVVKVNRYLHMSLTAQNATALQKKCIETTIDFLHSPRFIQEINAYTSSKKRNAFEAEFIRAVFDKPDLTPDETNLYINLCNDYIMASDIKKTIEKLNEMLNSVTDDPEGKISIGLAEIIGKKTGEYNDCVMRHQKLYQLLNNKRSERIKEKISINASIVHLVEFFKEEENRKTMLRIEEGKRKLVKEEIGKLSDMDEVMAVIMGINVSEAL